MNQVLCFLLVIFSASLPILSLIEPQNGTINFTIELIHRDSPLSPFYNPSMTRAELLTNAARRSISRLNYFRLSSKHKKGIQSMVIREGGEYLMKLSIGTPPVEILATADTGSDLIWVQCKPCQQCFPQDAPIFDPLNSSSYQGLSCKSKLCNSLVPQQCGSKQKLCQYAYSYGDKSFTIGDLATDILTFGSTSNGHAVSFPKTLLGCGHKNGGVFSSIDEGIIGLGPGPLSLISQLGAVIQHKFSYCLVPIVAENATSKMRFGKGAKISGKGVVSTPLVFKSSSSHYYLTLESISIGKKRVSANLGKLKGNIIIDSGSTLTYLESRFYNKLEAVLKDAISLKPILKPPSQYNLCYPATSSDSLFPDMMFHFNGADLNLNLLNYLVAFANGDDIVICLAIVPNSDDNLSIFGNVAQVNFRVEYDLRKKRVTFAPADCTKY